MPADGEQVCTLLASVPGTSYDVLITGTHFHGAFEGRMADAAYHADFFPGPVFFDPIPNAANWGLQLDGAGVTVGPYRDDHVYVSQNVPGTGDAFCFWIADDNYGDNLGALTVQVLPSLSFV